MLYPVNTRWIIHAFVTVFLLCGCCLKCGSAESRRREGHPRKAPVGMEVKEQDFENQDAVRVAPTITSSDYNDTAYWNFTTYPPYEAQNPGFRGRVTQKALDYATTLAIDILMSQIDFLNIPDIQQTIGSIDVQVNRVRIVRFDRPNAEFIPHPGSGISLKIWGLNVKVMALYEAEMGLGFFGTIHKSGTLSVKTKDLSLTVTLEIEKQPWTGLPSKLVPVCSSSGELIITFKGGWSDMLNVGSSVFATTIRSLIASQVCSAAQTEIDKNLNTEDGLLIFNQTILGLFDFHFTMTDFPVINEHFVESSHMGTTYYVHQWEEPPFSPAPIPSFDEHKNRMFYVYVSDYVLNSAFHAAHVSGILNYTVTPDLLQTLPLPPQFRQLLATSCNSPLLCLGILYPGLAKHFPGSLVNINVYATEAPNVTFYDGHSVRVKTSGNLEFLVESYGRVYPAFGLTFTVSVDVSLVVKHKKISFRLNSLSPSVDILYSNVDDVGTSFFYETIIRTGIRAALPFIEEFGEKGLDIPEILNLKIENSEIIVIEEQGVFVVATDIRVIIPEGINLIAMLGPQNDTAANTTESMNVLEMTSQVPAWSTRKVSPVVGPRSQPKTKRRRHRNHRRRRTTTGRPTESMRQEEQTFAEYIAQTTESLKQVKETMDDYIGETTEVAEIITQMTTALPVPRRSKTRRRRRKRPRAQRHQSLSK